MNTFRKKLEEGDWKLHGIFDSILPKHELGPNQYHLVYVVYATSTNIYICVYECKTNLRHRCGIVSTEKITGTQQQTEVWSLFFIPITLTLTNVSLFSFYICTSNMSVQQSDHFSGS